MEILDWTLALAGMGLAGAALHAAPIGDTVLPNSKTNNQEKTMPTFSAKRKAPKHVDPLALNGVRYEAALDIRELGYTGHGGVIAAYDETTGRQLWHVQVYRTEYNPTFEQDVQEAYIAAITAIEDGKALEVTNERQRRFRLDLADRSVKPLN